MEKEIHVFESILLSSVYVIFGLSSKAHMDSALRLVKNDGKGTVMKLYQHRHFLLTLLLSSHTVEKIVNTEMILP